MDSCPHPQRDDSASEERGTIALCLVLADALSRCLRSADEIAATEFVGDAKDDAAVAFCQKFGFTLLPKRESRLVHAMVTVAKLWRG